MLLTVLPKNILHGVSAFQENSIWCDRVFIFLLLCLWFCLFCFILPQSHPVTGFAVISKDGKSKPGKSLQVTQIRSFANYPHSYWSTFHHFATIWPLLQKIRECWTMLISICQSNMFRTGSTAIMKRPGIRSKCALLTALPLRHLPPEPGCCSL